MCNSNRSVRTYRYGLALFSATVAIVLSGAFSRARAQEASPFDQLTVENLIGKSVSLSNQDYPEVEKAIQRFRNSDGESALEFLKQAKEKYPKLPPADVIYAKMYMTLYAATRRQDLIRQAYALLERAAMEDPDDPEAYLLLADQAFIGGRITESQALFEYVDPLVAKFEGNAKRKQNFTIRLLAGRAAVAERRNQWEDANKWLEQWVEIDPENRVAHGRLGTTLFQLDKHRESLQAFTTAKELDSEKSPHPYVAIGQLFSRAGDQEKARKAFEKAYAEDNTDVGIAQSFANWLIQQDELEQAQAIAATMRGQNPDSVQAMLLDGIVALMQGNLEQAEQTMTQVLSLDPSNFFAIDVLAVLLSESDSPSTQKRGLSYANMNSQRFADNAKANITKGWVLYRLGRKQESDASLKKVGRGNVPVDSAFLLAKIMLEQGNKEKAIQTIEGLLAQEAGLFIYRNEAEQLLASLKDE